MIVSERRRAANLQNAQLSTGPRDTSKSRKNALLHGLCSSQVLAEDADRVSERMREFFRTLRPRNDFHCWIVCEISLLTLQIDRAERIERRARDKIAIRAETSWDELKRIEVETLAAKLAQTPAIVVDRLRATPHGCEWLMGRWGMLARAFDVKGVWTDSQAGLAFDLLATPADFRDGYKPGSAIDFFGNPTGPDLGPAELARQQVADLMVRRDEVAGLDQANRTLAMADLQDDPDADPELKRTRKYLASLHSKLRWCYRQLDTDTAPAEVPRWLEQKWLGVQTPWIAMKIPDSDELLPPKPVLETNLAESDHHRRTLEDRERVAREADAVLAARLAAEAASKAEPEAAEAESEATEAMDVDSAAFPIALTDRRLKSLRRAENRREAKERKREKLRA